MCFDSKNQAAKTVLSSPLAQTEIELEFTPFEIITVLFDPYKMSYSEIRINKLSDIFSYLTV